MFGSLLKYKLKASANIMKILSMILLIACLITGLVLSSDLTVRNNLSVSVMTTFIAGAVFLYLFIIAYIIATPLIQYYSYYKLHFDNEGYLTFTLPVSTHQQVLTGILAIIIWELIAVLVLICSVALLLLPSCIFAGEWPNLSGIFSGISAMDIALIFVVLVYSAVLPVTAITIGSLVAKKRKILASVGIGVGISYAVSLVSTVLLSNLSVANALDYALGVTLILYALLSVGGYFLTCRMINKNMNI